MPRGERMSEDLKSFKISDTARRGVDSPKKKGEEAGPPPSVGFPNIEAQVEQDGPALAGMRERHAGLMEMSKSGDPKAKAAARKAALGYERSLALLEHLLATKQQMIAPDSKG